MSFAVGVCGIGRDGPRAGLDLEHHSLAFDRTIQPIAHQDHEGPFQPRAGGPELLVPRLHCDLGRLLVLGQYQSVAPASVHTGGETDREQGRETTLGHGRVLSG